MHIVEEDVTHPGASLRLLRMELDEFRGPHHRHRHVELTWIERGSGLRSVGDSVMPFEDGDLVLLGPQVAHRWVTLGRRPAGRVVFTTMQFDPQPILHAPFPELRTASAVLLRAGRGLQVQGATRTNIVAALAAVPNEDAVGRLAGLVHILGLLARVDRGSADLKAIATHAAGPRTGAAAGDDSRRDRLVDWIHARLAGEITAAAAARVARVAESSFSRWFRRELGKNFTDYVNDARCSAACLRLAQSDASIARIAADSGFATLSNFNAQFKRRYGHTPREFHSGRG